jgi:hypothetical protein
MNDRLPDHSSLTRMRRRWGVDRFRKLFAGIVRACAAAGLAPGEVVHIDVEPLSRHWSERQWRRLIRADVSFDALVERRLDAVDAANLTQEERLTRTTGKFKKVCSTDPDAAMATNSRNQRLQPACKQHTAVDDMAGVIVDVEVVTGEEYDIGRVAERMDAIAQTLGRAPGVITADAACGTGKVYAALVERKIEAVIPHRPPTRRPDAKGFPALPLRRQGRWGPPPAKTHPDPAHGDKGGALVPRASCRLRGPPSPGALHPG